MSGTTPGYIELTVADHLQNGFVNLVRWSFPTVDDARQAIEALNAILPHPNPVDPGTDDFTFILDLHEGYPANMTDNSQPFTLQTAVRLAPSQVNQWLEQRPDPDTVLTPIPSLQQFPI